MYTNSTWKEYSSLYLTFQILAEIFQDLLVNKDDYVRALRALLREIVRSLRHDVNFQAFCLALMQKRTESKFTEMEASLKVTANLLCSIKGGCYRVLTLMISQIKVWCFKTSWWSLVWDETRLKANQKIKCYTMYTCSIRWLLNLSVCTINWVDCFVYRSVTCCPSQTWWLCVYYKP